MNEPDPELFDAIRRDHRGGERLPESLAERHGVDRRTVMEAITTVLPITLDIPADEEQLGEVRQCLEMLLEKDQAKAPEQRRGVFELYQELTLCTGRCPVSYRWVWQYITHYRARHAGAGPAETRSYEHTWAGATGSGKAEFVTELITDAVRDLAGLAIEGAMPAVDGAELGLVSLGAARARIDQALHELALTGLISGLTHARMSAFTHIPEDDLVQRVEHYHRLMTT
ncbi:hypothetical protein ACO0M4_28740 [Streptomyces sp. RGM 3693]|uniref:hypothetical protein n=1 Tax=Streptomyces sp. RGM 3693 TaxID=3413284 RepID=UPI003D2D23B7